MTYLAKPKLHHPALPKNALGFTRRDYEGASRRCAPAAATTRSRRRSSRRSSSSTIAAAPRRQAVRHRLLVEDADLLPRPVARLQQRARPHAVGADRRDARQPRPHLPRRLRRRRFGVDRPRPVRARACAAASTWSTSSRTTASTASPRASSRPPPTRASKAKRGAVNSDEPIDLVHARAAARRDVRRARLLRRQGAARAADQGGGRAPGRGVHRRRQPVRRVQQPPGLDQELRLRARAQRGGEPARLHARRATPITADVRAGRASQDVMLHDGGIDPPAQAACRVRPDRPGRRDGLPARARMRPAKSSPACCTSIRTRSTCTTCRTRSPAAQRAGRRRARAGQRGARGAQRALR